MFTLHRTNINIQQPISVYISHGNTRAPVRITCHTGFFGNIFKFKISFIQVKLIVTFAVCSKINIRQSIIVDITNGNTATIVIIEVIQNAKSLMFF